MNNDTCTMKASDFTVYVASTKLSADVFRRSQNGTVLAIPLNKYHIMEPLILLIVQDIWMQANTMLAP
jgi:hypothetical protein